MNKAGGLYLAFVGIVVIGTASVAIGQGPKRGKRSAEWVKPEIIKPAVVETPAVVVKPKVVKPKVVKPAVVAAPRRVKPKPVGRGGGVVLKPELVVGSEYEAMMTGRTVMEVPKSGERADQKVDVEQRYTVAVDLNEDEKSKTVEVTVDAVRIDMRMPGLSMSYDSTNPATRDAVMGAPYKRLINKPVEMVYDEDDKFVKMAATEAFPEGPGISSPFGQQIGPDQIKQMVKMSVAEGFPDEAVSPGDTWEYSVKVPIPGMGEIAFDLVYDYTTDVNVEGYDCAKIVVKGKMTTESMASKRKEADSGFRLDDGFEKGEVSGTLVVDKKLRIVRESDFNMDMVLKLPSPLGQESLKLPVKQEMQTSIVSFRQLR